MAHSIGKTIAELRKAKGWTQIELAEKLQVSDKAISKWEKDSGAPSVEFFPALAEIFGVSIDYIMTGKKVEPEIITMSKIELCAKNDDVALFESLSEEVLKNSDENGKTILDYFLKYGTKKAVEAFFNKYPAKGIQQTNGYRAGTPLWYTDKVIKLLIINNMVKELQSINAFVRNTSRQKSEWDIYTKEYQKLVLTNVNVGVELKECYFKSFTAEEINQALCLALDEKKEKDVSLLWKIITNINNKNIEAKECKAKEVAGRYMTSVSYSNVPCIEYEAIGTGCYYRYYVVSLNVETLQKLLNNGYVDTVRQANLFNEKIGATTINEEAIRMAILKQNGGSEDEIKALSVLQNGIVNIDQLLETKNFKFIKKTLNEQPIHLIEVLYNKRNDKRCLFRYAVDMGDTELADMVVKNEMDIISRDTYIRTNTTSVTTQKMPQFDRLLLIKYWYNYQSNILNKAHLYIIENGKKVDLLGAYYGNRLFKPKNLEEVITKLQSVKQRIIDELSLKLDKEKTIGDLTKEYFETELAKGNIEIVIIKLCVRLEAILRSDYLYEGDFSEMLKKYCDSKLHWEEDDGWGYMVNKSDDKTIRLLNNLRIKRNSIVHSEKTNIELSLEEIRYCIDYICKMG